MIAAAMEMRRMGLSEKNMFVVPNNIVGQWKTFSMKCIQVLIFFVLTRKVSHPQKEKVFSKEYETMTSMVLL